MNSSRQALQTIGELFSNFELVFEFLVESRKFFKRIARLEYYQSTTSYIWSMDSFRQALQTNGKLFQISNSFSNYWPKQKNIQTNSDVWILIKVQYVRSINVSQQALQINGKLFFQISESFFELITLFKIILAFGLGMRGGGRHLCWSANVLVQGTVLGHNRWKSQHVHTNFFIVLNESRRIQLQFEANRIKIGPL